MRRLLALGLCACVGGPMRLPKGGESGGTGHLTDSPAETDESGRPDTGPVGDTDHTAVEGDEDGDGYYGGQGGEDCDDGDPEVHPHAGEVCGDGVDNDCDGAAGTCELGASSVRVTGARSGDDVGFSVAVAGDVNGDGAWDLLTGGVTADVGITDAGAIWLMSGPFEASTTRDAAVAVLGGAEVDGAAGYTVCGPGDLNGDGYADILGGAPYALDAAGRVYVELGPVSGASSLSAADGIWVGEAAGDRAGIALAAVGDTDGDEVGDLLVGANTADIAATDAGVSYLLSGAVAPAGGGLESASGRLVGDGESDKSGRVSGAGDVDGDGLNDLLAGAPGSDMAAADAGLAALMLAPLTGDVSLSDADAILLGEVAGDRAGVGLAGLGDADGDGLSDLAIGANNADGVGSDTGGVYLLLGLSLGTSGLVEADARLLGEAAGDNAGWPLAAPGDLDGDGLADLLVGAYGQDHAANASGAAYVVLGTHGGTSSLGDALSRWYGGTENGLLGFALAGSGAAGGPVLIGAPGEGSGLGAVYVLKGAY